MAYYLEERSGGPALAPRRPTINEFFLSTYQTGAYAGCEIGCGYCDGWSYNQRPFNEVVRAFVDLPERFADHVETLPEGELIAFNLADPYQSAERTYRLTRQMLQACHLNQQPVLIQTKSHHVLEDLKLLQRMNEASLAIVVFTFVTVDPLLAEKLEGRAPPPSVRLEAMQTLQRAGIPTAVSLMPVIPYLTDTDRQLPVLLEALAAVNPQWICWEYLWQPNERHRIRMADLLNRLGNYPAAYYRELYGQELQPRAEYQREMNREILGRCEVLGMPVRAPLNVYREHLSAANSAALLLKHQAFEDRIKGRELLADRHQRLAEAVFNGKADEAALSVSPLWPTLRELLNLKAPASRLDDLMQRLQGAETDQDKRE